MEKNIKDQPKYVRVIKKEIKRQNGYMEKYAVLKDSNCYGDHFVTIELS